MSEEFTVEINLSNFNEIYSNDPHSRYRSYEHCRNYFLAHRKDISKYDVISLHLYAYLASWGMLRNSFLLQKDYLFNEPIVEILCKEKYDKLLSFCPFDDDASECIQLILELKDEISNYYLCNNYYKDDDCKCYPIKNITDTLISKIILGTFGCVPAYDNYVKIGLKKLKISQTFNKKSLLQLVDFAKDNRKEIEQIQINNKLNAIYTPMKVLDMFLYEYGMNKK